MNIFLYIIYISIMNFIVKSEFDEIYLKNKEPNKLLTTDITGQIITSTASTGTGTGTGTVTSTVSGDLSDYIKTVDADTKYSTKTYVNNQVAALNNSLTNFATQQNVDTTLLFYTKKTETEAYITELKKEIEDNMTQNLSQAIGTAVNTAKTEIIIPDYFDTHYLKDETYTQTEVVNVLNEALTAYPTKMQMNLAIDDAINFNDISTTLTTGGYLNNYYLKNEVDNLLNKPIDLSNYTTNETLEASYYKKAETYNKEEITTLISNQSTQSSIQQIQNELMDITNTVNGIISHKDIINLNNDIQISNKSLTLNNSSFFKRDDSSSYVLYTAVSYVELLRSNTNMILNLTGSRYQISPTTITVKTDAYANNDTTYMQIRFRSFTTTTNGDGTDVYYMKVPQLKGLSEFTIESPTYISFVTINFTGGNPEIPRSGGVSTPSLVNGTEIRLNYISLYTPDGQACGLYTADNSNIPGSKLDFAIKNKVYDTNDTIDFIRFKGETIENSQIELPLLDSGKFLYVDNNKALKSSSFTIDEVDNLKASIKHINQDNDLIISKNAITLNNSSELLLKASSSFDLTTDVKTYNTDTSMPGYFIVYKKFSTIDALYALGVDVPIPTTPYYFTIVNLDRTNEWATSVQLALNITSKPHRIDNLKGCVFTVVLNSFNRNPTADNWKTGSNVYFQGTLNITYTFKIDTNETNIEFVQNLSRSIIGVNSVSIKNTNNVDITTEFDWNLSAKYYDGTRLNIVSNKINLSPDERNELDFIVKTPTATNTLMTLKESGITFNQLDSLKLLYLDNSKLLKSTTFDFVDINNLISDVKNLNTLFDTLTDNVTSIITSNETLTANVETLTANVATLTAANQRMASDIQRLETRFTNLERRVNTFHPIQVLGNPFESSKVQSLSDATIETESDDFIRNLFTKR